MLFGTIHKLQFCSFFRFDILYFTLHPGALIISLQNWSFRKDKVYRVLLYMLLCWTLNPSWTLEVNPGSLFRFFSSLLFIELAIVVSIKKIMMYLSIIQRHKKKYRWEIIAGNCKYVKYFKGKIQFIGWYHKNVIVLPSLG